MIDCMKFASVKRLANYLQSYAKSFALMSDVKEARETRFL